MFAIHEEAAVRKLSIGVEIGGPEDDGSRHARGKQPCFQVPGILVATPGGQRGIKLRDVREAIFEMGVRRHDISE
ncbi:MAG: hypothetical protein ABIP13_03575 [Tepidiformaceae bacterium]